MNTYQCSIQYGNSLITSEREAASPSKARYAFYQEYFSESPYSEMFRYIKSKKVDFKSPPIDKMADIQALVAKINGIYTIGDKVQVRQDDGKIKEWTIKHPATILGGHSAVIWCNECVGCFCAKRVIFV